MLIRDDVVEAIGGNLRGGARGGVEGSISDCDIAFGRPHGEGGVSDMPGSGEPGCCWRCEGG